ncbi:MAG: right-handed parallel beta-helix repeat-containing protein [Clostridia bacterium]|nr:right-handed parallel beta-helix repeat-containing protein [Clostridia bacterium]
MEKLYFLADYGILEDTDKDYTKELQELFDKLPNGAVVQFKKGNYNIFGTIEVNNKKDIQILGNCATITAFFDPTGPIKNNNNVFNFSGCSNVIVQGFFFTTNNNIGATGEVVAIDKENSSCDLLFSDEFKWTGFEHIVGTNSFNEKGSPDYAIATYDHNLVEEAYQDKTRLVGRDYEVLAPNLIRLKGIYSGDPINKLKIGHKMNIRYEIYGTSVFNFISCHNVLLKDIVIHSAASFGATVRPRSSNFTFDNFSMRLPNGTERVFCANADGVHILGLMGKLIFKNCNIEGLGDDTLNIHGIAAKTENLDTENRTLFAAYARNKERPLPDFWACEGDIIHVYDPKTFLKKAEFTVETIDKNYNIRYKNLIGNIENDDVLSNSVYYASVHIDGCTLKNTRARGLLIQSQNVLIENSYIYGMSLPAMLFAPDIRVWYEVGPVQNVEIRNNVIEYCAHTHYGANVGAIVFKSCHDVGGNDYPSGVHSNINIHDNLFIDCANSAIFVSAADHVKIQNNRFKNCCFDPQNKELSYANYDIVTINCTDILVSGNTSDRAGDTIHINLTE